MSTNMNELHSAAGRFEFQLSLVQDEKLFFVQDWLAADFQPTALEPSRKIIRHTVYGETTVGPNLEILYSKFRRLKRNGVQSFCCKRP